MRFNWIYEKNESLQIKTFLKQQGVSKGLLARVKFHGGKIEVNQEEKNVLYYLSKGEKLALTIPDEQGTEAILVSHEPISIVFEDEHILIIDKPAGVASLPSNIYVKDTMANRVKGYFIRQKYASTVIHIVTRLDKDTSGLMIFAKHRYAHALMDQQLRLKQIQKKYVAAINGHLQQNHGMINAPIARTDHSIVTRRVHDSGKPALTEYWVRETFEKGTLAEIQLHTGRTHQIRVHFSYIGHPLISDTLYGAPEDQWISRQALHCRELTFTHPLTKQPVNFKTDVPSDLREWLRHQKIVSYTQKGRLM